MKEMFNANSGLFHFVFANPKEDYYLDSLIKMDMNEYLFYLLKKENYQEVYFVEEKIQKYGSRYVIKMKEETAFDFLEQYNKKTFMGSIKKIVVGGGDGEKKDGFLLTEPLSEEILKGLMKKYPGTERERLRFCNSSGIVLSVVSYAGIQRAFIRHCRL